MIHQTAQEIEKDPVTAPVAGNPLSIGEGFSGLGFRHTQFNEAMDPLILVDHYTMTTPTFGAHPHAGISAVSVLFEDTKGKFNNRDSLGNNFDIHAGDLYWLNAGSGAIHDEAPRQGAKIHGLQIFVNLPAHLKHNKPSSLHVKREAMPTLQGQGYRVRLAIGESNGIKTDAVPVWPVTILDGFADNTAVFEHRIQTGFNSWIYAIEGGINYRTNNRWLQLKQGESCVIREAEGDVIQVRGTSASRSHFALLSGKKISEPFVHQGPFAMSSQSDIDDVLARYKAGELGQLS